MTQLPLVVGENYRNWIVEVYSQLRKAYWYIRVVYLPCYITLSAYQSREDGIFSSTTKHLPRHPNLSFFLLFWLPSQQSKEHTQRSDISLRHMQVPGTYSLSISYIFFLIVYMFLPYNNSRFENWP